MLLAVTPALPVAIFIGAAKLVPVSVTLTVVPGAPLLGLIDVRVGIVETPGAILVTNVVPDAAVLFDWYALCSGNPEPFVPPATYALPAASTAMAFPASCPLPPRYVE